MVPFENLGTVFYYHSIVTMALFYIISEIKQDIGRKSRLFSFPAFDGPVRGVSVGILPYHLVRMTRPRMVWLLDSEKKFDDMFSRFDRTSACGRQTDFCYSIVRAMHSIAW